MTSVQREGDLFGLAVIIADMLEGNLLANPHRERLLEGEVRRVTITASDIDTNVGLELGGGMVRVSGTVLADSHMHITTDSSTLLDLPNAKLLWGLPSLGDATGRAVTKKMLTGKLKVKGITRIGLLTRVQKLLSVA